MTNLKQEKGNFSTNTGCIVRIKKFPNRYKITYRILTETRISLSRSRTNL